MNEQQKIEQEKEIVIARLETVSPNINFFDGDGPGYSRDDIIRLIREDSSVGLDYVRKEFNFMRAVANGEVQKQIVSILSDTDGKNSIDHQSKSGS